MATGRSGRRRRRKAFRVCNVGYIAPHKNCAPRLERERKSLSLRQALAIRGKSDNDKTNTLGSCGGEKCTSTSFFKSDRPLYRRLTGSRAQSNVESTERGKTSKALIVPPFRWFTEFTLTIVFASEQRVTSRPHLPTHRDTIESSCIVMMMMMNCCVVLVHRMCCESSNRRSPSWTSWFRRPRASRTEDHPR